MYLAIDIGGTKTLAAVFNENGEVVEQTKFATSPDYEAFLASLNTGVKTLSTSNFTAGGVGIRGQVDRISGSLVRDSLLNWRNAPLAADFKNLFSCDFKVENDSKLAGLSEARKSEARNKRILYITISSGIGSVYVVNGSIDPNLDDSEIGLWIYEHEGSIQTWESFASGKAIVNKYGKLASELEDPIAWQSATKNMALGFVNAAAAYTPDLIIIGGGVGSHYPKFEKYLLEAITNLTPDGVSVPPIKQAQNPEQAVIYGCYELIRQD